MNLTKEQEIETEIQKLYDTLKNIRTRVLKEFEKMSPYEGAFKVIKREMHDFFDILSNQVTQFIRIMLKEKDFEEVMKTITKDIVSSSFVMDEYRKNVSKTK